MTHVSRAVAVVVVLVGALLVWAGTPTSLGAYTSKVTNTTNTAASGIWATTCLAQAKADGAYFFYELDDASRTAGAVDSTTNNRPGSYSTAGVTYRNAVGPCTRDAHNSVILLNGTSGYVLGPQITGAGPTTFSEEVWFKTNTTTGGKLIGLGTSGTATASGTYDRHIYMNNDGKLTAGIYDGTVRTIQSAAAYNDNAWHQAVFTVATSGTNKGMTLYVDGAQVAANANFFTSETGTNYYVRIGYDNLDAWTNVPTSRYFKGNLADVSFYNGTALSASQVAAHYNARS